MDKQNSPHGALTERYIIIRIIAAVETLNLLYTGNGILALPWYFGSTSLTAYCWAITVVRFIKFWRLALSRSSGKNEPSKKQ
jgi:hypothetical protein